MDRLLVVLTDPAPDHPPWRGQAADLGPVHGRLRLGTDDRAAAEPARGVLGRAPLRRPRLVALGLAVAAESRTGPSLPEAPAAFAAAGQRTVTWTSHVVVRLSGQSLLTDTVSRAADGAHLLALIDTAATSAGVSG